MATEVQISEAKTRAQIAVSQVVIAHNEHPELGILNPSDIEHLMDQEFSRWLKEIVERDQPTNQGFPWAPVLVVVGSAMLLVFMAWIQYFQH